MTIEDLQNSDARKAAELIMDAIVTQKLAPSQKVSENIFSDMFGISRTISRNLIERLIAKQFLVSVSPRVTIVAPLTLLDIKQNFTLRKVLLPAIFSLTAANVDFARLRELNKEIEAMQPILDDDTALALLKKNKDLNLLLCENAGYPLMMDWARQLEDTAMRIYWLYLKTQKRFPYSPDQQGMTIDVMKTDEPHRIKTVIHDILSQTEERILNTIFSNEQFYTQDLKV
ncbi:GntR family transcriptional regulator [Kordiimonas gwangyangensis]|uniref:GntR family transcriptional regulator n=1 Tax=Kordiimonas gwangyangensis TaxID=288022 RepID=UPI000367E6F0|nr:GntR family transcriptional regulator [Kordiimonas gwangyangensis]